MIRVQAKLISYKQFKMHIHRRTPPQFSNLSQSSVKCLKSQQPQNSRFSRSLQGHQSRPSSLTISNHTSSIKHSPAKLKNQNCNNKCTLSPQTQKLENLIQRKQELRQQKSDGLRFMNVISKKNISPQILKFLSGEDYLEDQKPKSNQPTIMKASFMSQIPTQSQINVTKFGKHEQESQNSFRRQATINSRQKQSFPLSKIKRPRSCRKTNEDKVQLSGNCKTSFQLQCNQNQTLYVSKGSFCFKDSQAKDTRQSNASNLETKDEWNSTVKFSSRQLIRLADHNDTLNAKSTNKMPISGTQSTTIHDNSSFQTILISKSFGSQQDNKNLTQKISEFIVCDQQAVPRTFQCSADLQRQEKQKKNQIQVKTIPIFSITLEDLRNPIFVKQNETINGFNQNQKSEQIDNKFVDLNQCVNLGHNLQVLQKNITELKNTIESIPFSYHPNHVQLFLERTQEKQQVYKLKDFQQSHSFKIYDSEGGSNCGKEEGGKNQAKKQYSIEDKGISAESQSEETSQARQTFHLQNSFNPKYSHSIETSVNQFPIEKTQENTKNWQQDQKQKQLRRQIQQNCLLSSLQIIDHCDKGPILGNSLENFYLHPEVEVQMRQSNQMSLEASKQLENKSQKSQGQGQDNQYGFGEKVLQNNTNGQYHLERESPKFEDSFVRHPLIYDKKDQRKEVQNSKPISQNQINQTILLKLCQKDEVSNRNFPHQQTLIQAINNIQTSTRQMINKICDKSESQNHALNYEMFKTYKKRNFSKKLTNLLVNQEKNQVIELPYLQNPIKTQQGKFIYPKYIKNKIYYCKT